MSLHLPTLTVPHCLLRLEPHTSRAIRLQGGQKLDVADRLFHSVPQAWDNVTTSHADVKELVPEFFYLAECLEDSGRLPLGRRQDGAAGGDVQLPPWARGSPERFVPLVSRSPRGIYV